MSLIDQLYLDLDKIQDSRCRVNLLLFIKQLEAKTW